MKLLSHVLDVRAYVAKCRQDDLSIGFIPTMGSLHEGHLALIKKARAAHDRVVVSIFVNPLQFGSGEDFERYPRVLERDKVLLKQASVDLLFAPRVYDIYPQPMKTFVDCTDLGHILEGASRPGHFNGVATVVLKFFNIIQPDAAYFGEKDYQQVLIIRRMVDDLSVPVDLVTIPTVRDTDGLALSSRNAYLTPQERKAATILNRALDAAGNDILMCQTAHDVEGRLRSFIEQEPLACIETVAVCDADTLQNIQGTFPRWVFVFLYVRFGTTYLLDHRIIKTRTATESDECDPMSYSAYA